MKKSVNKSKNVKVVRKNSKSKKKTARTKKEPITKDILMGELVSKYPETSEVLLKHGLHCIGCMFSPYESLEAGLAVHGIPLNPLLKELNRVLDKKNKNKKTGGF